MEAAWQELRRALGSAGDPVGIRGGSKGDPEQKWGIRISADLAAMGDPARPVNPFIILKAGNGFQRLEVDARISASVRFSYHSRFLPPEFFSRILPPRRADFHLQNFLS